MLTKLMMLLLILMVSISCSKDLKLNPYTTVIKHLMKAHEKTNNKQQ